MDFVTMIFYKNAFQNDNSYHFISTHQVFIVYLLHRDLSLSFSFYFVFFISEIHFSNLFIFASISQTKLNASAFWISWFLFIFKLLEKIIFRHFCNNKSIENISNYKKSSLFLIEWWNLRIITIFRRQQSYWKRTSAQN